MHISEKEELAERERERERESSEGINDKRRISIRSKTSYNYMYIDTPIKTKHQNPGQFLFSIHAEKERHLPILFMHNNTVVADKDDIVKAVYSVRPLSEVSHH